MSNFSICFDRQLGSGGREIAGAVANELGFRFLDKEIIALAAEHGNLSKDTAESIDEKPTTSLLYSVVTNTAHYTAGGLGYNVPINDKLYIAQTEVIKDIASKENAVFVGRCSDHILAKDPHALSVFIYANDDFRAERVMNSEGCDKKKALDIIAKGDKKRASYYNFYTGKKWGAMQYYDLCVNSSLLGIEGTAKLIADFARKFMDAHR
ncbi:MAG: cytidylate kinase-like family protein [Clostridia bacterium]|nr:cytidylate kinase-like family protein [Clostridia bacterium]